MTDESPASPQTQRNYFIDAARVRGLKGGADSDPDAPDAVWVPVVSPDREECSSPEARIDAQRYVSNKGRGTASGIDVVHGPIADNNGHAPQHDALNFFGQAITSAAEYVNTAAAHNLDANRKIERFVTWYRVRRSDLI